MMKNIVFACDLDNTMIHSAKRMQPGDVCVEYIHDKPQSYMSPMAVELFRKVQEKVLFLPITTRSIEQYQRIIWPQGCEPSYAITTNGGNLLCDGVPDEAWRADSEELVKAYRAEYDRLLEDMLASELFIRCRLVDDLVLFGYCKDGVDAAECRAFYQKKTELPVVVSGRKLYIMPKLFEKGEALSRFLKRESAEFVFAAGDSVMDVSMLKKADQSFIPNQGLLYALPDVNVLACPDKKRFSEFFLEQIAQTV